MKWNGNHSSLLKTKPKPTENEKYENAKTLTFTYYCEQETHAISCDTAQCKNLSVSLVTNAV